MNRPRVTHPTRVAGSRSIGDLDPRTLAACADVPPYLPEDPVPRAAACLASTARDGVGDERRRALVDEALRLDPSNADALRLVADRLLDPSKRAPALERAIAVALERLGGEAVVTSLEGAAWSDAAARPYLRARARLAETLIEVGRIAEAIVACEAMLGLDPTDPLGMRNRLGTLYLQTGRVDAFAQLVGQPTDDEPGLVCWGRVLAALLADDEDAAWVAYRTADEACRDVAEFLLTPWILPDPPDQYEPGDESEAIVVAHELYPAFCAAPAALAWVRTRTPVVGPRPNREQRVFAALRPEGDVDSEPLWLEWLLRSNGYPSEALEAAVRVDVDRATPWIVSLFESDELDQEGALGDGLGPASAACLLGRLAHPAALEPLAAALARAGTTTSRWDALLCAFDRYGASALAPLLAVRRAIELGESEHRDLRLDDVCDPLSTLGVRDERVFDAILTAFEHTPGVGAVHLAKYGDSRAIPILTDWLAGRQLDFTDESSYSNADLTDVLMSLRELAGSLTPAQQALVDRVFDFRSALRDDRKAYEPDSDDDEDGEDGDDPADKFDDDIDFDEVVEGPASDDLFLTAGRNAPCPCGSGKKYKKCCWDSKRSG